MKSIELAMKAGLARKSAVTHFVHHCAHDLDHASHAIPVFENFCFTLALFRTKLVENILEARALLERLFPFQTAEGFPLYLHEYPTCRSRKLAQKLGTVAHFLLRDFTSALGEKLREKVRTVAISVCASPTPSTPEEWADFLIHTQVTGGDPTPAAFQVWDFQALCYKGPQQQERQEPAVTLLDLILGEWSGSYSPRALQDHAVHLQAALIYPRHVVTPGGVDRGWVRRFWGDGNPTHSSMLYGQGIVQEHGNTAIITLAEKDVQDEVEVSYFLDRAAGVKIGVNGKKATTFQLGDTVSVESEGKAFDMTFSLLEGRGRFWGHLYFGNRPGQIGCRGALKHEAFDWQIALRTIERKEKCTVKIDFREHM